MLDLLSNIQNPRFQVETTVKNGKQVIAVHDETSGLRLSIIQPAFQLDEFLQLFGNAEPEWRALAIKLIKDHDPKSPSQLTVGLLKG